ncbi:hypothetical protein ACWKSP_26670 [Micromonosporaceae bacterium Da 78-11]
MDLEAFNVLLAAAGLPTVVVTVGIITNVMVKRQTPAIDAYIRATEPRGPQTRPALPAKPQVKALAYTDSNAR